MGGLGCLLRMMMGYNFLFFVDQSCFLFSVCEREARNYDLYFMVINSGRGGEAGGWWLVAGGWWLVFPNPVVPPPSKPDNRQVSVNISCPFSKTQCRSCCEGCKYYKIDGVPSVCFSLLLFPLLITPLHKAHPRLLFPMRGGTSGTGPGLDGYEP